MLLQDLANKELVSLYLDLKPDQEVDLEIAAEAAIEWARALKAAARALDDTKEYRVNLVAAEPGSKRWLAKIEESEPNQKVVSAQEKWNNIPLIVRYALAATVVIPTTAIPTYKYWTGDDGFSETQIKELEKIMSDAGNDPEVKTHKQAMFRKCQKDSTITGLGGGVPDKENWRPLELVPANRFPEGDGLFDIQEEEPEEKKIFQELDVVLVSPNLDNPKLSWIFRQEGIPGTISAAMADEKFLNALENSEVKEKFHSPIHMKIRLKIIQEMRDGEWVTKHGGRSVVEVIKPKTS